MCQLRKLRALSAACLVVCSLLTASVAAQELQLGSTIERRLAGNERHVFTISLEENQLIQFVVEQRGVDIVVRIASPAGKTLGEFDSPNGADGPENVSFVAAAAGVYSISVAPLNENQIGTGQYQIKIVELRKATEEEIKISNNLETLKTKGMALLVDLEGLIPEIKSPHTRVRAQIQAAQLLWEPDEKRALKYMNDAMTGVKEFMATVDPGSQEYFRHYSTIMQLRHEIAQALAPHDPDAALAFIYATKAPKDPYGNKREQASQESGLELSIVNEILRKDAKRAFQIARQNLKRGYSYNLLSTVSKLRSQNPELAVQLANEVTTKLLGEKLLKNGEAASLSVNMIRLCRTPQRRIQRYETNGVSASPAEPLLPEEVCRDLLQKTLQEGLSYAPPNPLIYTPERDAAFNLLNGLQGLGQELETVMTGGLAAVERKLAELNSSINPNGAVFQQIQVKIDSGSGEALEAIQKAPEEIREQLYIQLANRTAANGDMARARQIINDHISNAWQRRQALTNLEQQEMYVAMSKGKVEEALRTIAALKTPRERANMLMQVARQIGPGRKRATALDLLEQARSLLGPGPQAQDQEQMNALLEIARAFSRYDSKRAFEIVEPLVDQLNDLCTAARTLDGFGMEYFDGEEFDVQNGNSLSNLAIQISGALGTLATTNFERARLAADKLRLPEVRLRAYLDVAQQTIQGAR